MANTWRITRNDASTSDITRADGMCPYPWYIGVAVMDPASSTSPPEWYAATNVRSIALLPLPATGQYLYTVTPNSGPAVTVRTDDPDGMAIYGDNFATISRVGADGKRFVVLAVRWDFLTSVVRS